MKQVPLTNRILKLKAILALNLSHCKTFTIATAFIDDLTIDEIESALKSNNNLVSAKLLIGVFGSFNRKADLERLAELGKTYASKVELHVSRNRNFHWKYYHFLDSRKHSIFIGSANFTNGGLESNSELLLKLTFDTGTENQFENSLTKEFNNEWDESAVITEFPIEFYKENRSRNEGNDKFPSKINEFFNSKKKTSPNKIISENAVVTFFDSDVSAKTQKIVTNLKPQWNSVEYFILNKKSHAKNCQNIKRILKIDRMGRGEYNAYWVKYIDHLEYRTPDGKYFVAYESLSKPKRITSKIYSKLTDKNGINWKLEGRKGVLDTIVIRKNQLKEIEELFGSVK